MPHGKGGPMVPSPLSARPIANAEAYAEQLIFPKAPPEGALFAFRVPQEDSAMLPLFQAGAILYVTQAPLHPGDIGLFLLDGQPLCRQYHWDGMLQIRYLFALNRRFPEADVVLTSGSPRRLVCLGKIDTETDFPLPHE